MVQGQGPAPSLLCHPGRTLSVDDHEPLHMLLEELPLGPHDQGIYRPEVFQYEEGQDTFLKSCKNSVSRGGVKMAEEQDG